MESPRLIAIGVFILLIFLGLIQVLRAFNKIVNRINFAREFRERFIQFTYDLSDQKQYKWLVFNAGRIQRESGLYGIADKFQPAYGNYIIPNYQIFVNLLSEIARWFQQSHTFRFAGPEILNEYTQMYDDSLLNYLSFLSERNDALKKDIRNPFTWLREGIRCVVKSPISLMHWTGIIDYSRYTTTIRSPITKAAGFIIATAGFISDLFTIATGYLPFIHMIKL